MRTLLWNLIVVLALLVPAAPADAASVKGRRPNIILVMTDDQGMGDLSCMGNKDLKTPHLDRLYGVSTRFTDFHVSPTCAPTRSALLSGRHEFRNGVTHTILERERMALSTTTIAQVLQKAGYATGIFGKWHLGDEEPYQPQNRGFDEVFIHGAGGIGQAYSSSCADAPNNSYFGPAIRHNGKFVKTDGFCTDVFFQQALAWIREQQKAGKPFFTYLTPNAPHGPFLAPDEYKKPFLDAGFDERTAGRYGMIANIDANMGLLMKKMDDWKLWDNTLLIFMTDNGQAGRSAQKNGKRVQLFAGGLRAGKGSVYEGGTHVPAFWRWKGVLGEGTDINALAAHIDLFKTFAELAGAEIPEGIQEIDGRSLVPLLDDPKAKWEDRYLFSHKGRWAKGAEPNKDQHVNCAVRSQRWRLVNHKELYDIAADPGEENEVAADHPDVVKKMQAVYDAWWEKTRPLMVNESVPNADERPYHVLYEKQLKAEGIGKWQAPKLD